MLYDPKFYQRDASDGFLSMHIAQVRNNSYLDPGNSIYFDQPAQIKRSNSAVNDPLSIVLDLDHTLITSSVTPPDISDFIIYADGCQLKETYYVQKRPFLEKFLSSISHLGKMYIYTAAKRDYTEQILQYIDPVGKYFQKVFCREDCREIEDGKFVKNIQMIQSALTRTVIIDDDKSAFGINNTNLLRITPYYGNYKDRELEKFEQIIKRLSYMDDVRPFIAQYPG